MNCPVFAPISLPIIHLGLMNRPYFQNKYFLTQFLSCAGTYGASISTSWSNDSHLSLALIITVIASRSSCCQRSISAFVFTAVFMIFWDVRGARSLVRNVLFGDELTDGLACCFGIPFLDISRCRPLKASTRNGLFQSFNVFQRFGGEPGPFY